jgi:hypothetical protein
MPLTDPQIEELADAIEQHLDDNTLLLYATDLGVPLANQTVGVRTLRERAVGFIKYMNSQLPPRDAELLEMVRTRANAALQTVAARLLTPAYFSPTNDPHDAIVLGQRAFIARPDLRSRLRAFTTGVNQATTRMLVVRGSSPSGKSYTWEFLRHLAFASVGAQPFRHRLKGKGEQYTPRQLFEDVFHLLDLKTSTLPTLTDDPQLSRLDALVTTFKGKIVGLKRRYWLVIDDLNDPSVTPAIREAAFAIAQSAEEVKPQYLWVALLGYNEPILDPDLRFIAQDDAEFPNPFFVAQHLRTLSNAGPKPLDDGEETEIADLLFQKFTTLDKAAMTELTILVERMGEKLRKGERPRP